MITKINIHNVATFDTTTIDNLKKFNYFFGANGTGKTTISKVIADPAQYPDCHIVWENGIVMETRVYNRDFVERNFNQRIPGVFTLGEQEADMLEKIEVTKSEIKALDDDVANLKHTLQGDNGQGGKTGELAALENKYLERFFTQKQKHDAKLAKGLEGVRNNRERFKEKVLSEAANNTSNLLTLAEIETSATTIFSDKLASVQSITGLQPQRLLSLESTPILAKRVLGKENVDIAAIINKLNNSDWVRQGLPYYEANNGICPFCQQKTHEGFAKSLADYFDETFEQDNQAIQSLIVDYTTESDRIQQQVQTIIDFNSEFIDGEKLEAEKKLLDSKIAVNVQRLDQKKKEASQVVELDSLKNVLDEIVSLIANANIKIDKHNNIVSNITREKSKLIRQIWRFIIEELKTDIADYRNQKKDLITAIHSLQTQVQSKENEKKTKSAVLRELEKQNISIQPTLDGINNLLTSFGFTNFKLNDGGDGRTYKLTRANGSDAQKTLSEGERNFITFLYFYHWLKGSHDENGITVDKVVVFDDPVSSLDSDILFVVSSMIREMYEDLRTDKETIKQLFILTHNVYFHKEVTYDSKRDKDKVRKDESFWLVKKHGDNSFTEMQTSNPIRTSYELLWREVKESANQRNNVTIQNTLRRILENYFRLLGGISLDELYTKFEGDDKIKCKNLCSWVNDGSHSGGIFSDEYYTMPDDATVEKYLQVFKAIFEQCHHVTHYNMMMGIDADTDRDEDDTLNE
jgi:wobble nucleotide-excising tRNase